MAQIARATKQNPVVSHNLGYLFEGPYKKDCNILESILGSPYFGNLPNLNHNRNSQYPP